MTPMRRRRPRALAAVTLAGGLAALACVSSGSAASIWWAESSSGQAGFPTGRVAKAPLAGGGPVETYVDVPGRPSSIAVVGAQTAWNTIGSAPYLVSTWNVAKTGSAATLVSSPQVPAFGADAINSATGKIYYALRGAVSTAGLVQVANVDGSGTPTTLYTRGQNTLLGSTAIDVAGNRLYWCDFTLSGTTGDTAGSIMRGSLDGTATPVELFSHEYGCNGIAIDVAAGKMYWSRFSTSRNQDNTSLIRVGNLDGSGVPSTLYSEGDGSSSGLALDVATGRLYWANQPTAQNSNPGTGSIRVGHISGSPAAADLYTGVSNPNGVSLDGQGTAPAPTPEPTPAPAPTPAPVTQVVTKVGAVRIGRAPGVRGAARRVSLTLRYDEGGRFSFIVRRPNGTRSPLLPGSTIGTRKITTKDR